LKDDVSEIILLYRTFYKAEIKREEDENKNLLLSLDNLSKLEQKEQKKKDKEEETT